MVLNLVALGCMGGAIVAALILFRRHARGMNLAGAGGSPNVCLRCGTPAEALTAFTCPGCGHDVREKGLGPRRQRSAVARFWFVVSFTCAYLAVVMIASNVLSDRLPRVQTVSRNTSMTVSSPQIRGVELALEATGPENGTLTGTLSGELYGAAGTVVIEIDRPSLQWRLLDLAGKQLDAGDTLDGKVVYRWMELGGAPTDTPVAHSDAAHIADALAQLAGRQLEMPLVPGTGRALSLSYSSSSGGSSFTQPDARWLPLIVIGASAVWLAGVYLLTRPGRPGTLPTSAPVAAAEGVAP